MPYANSITLGKGKDGIVYKAKGYQHILLLAPHGSGKGVAFVLPTLLTLEESCIVHDIKLENYKLTSGYRESIGHKIFVFSPLSLEYKTHRYNPLDFISEDIKKRINDLQKIADLLIDASETSKILFVGLALYLVATDAKKTIGAIAKMINGNLEQELSDGLKKIDVSNNKYCAEILTGFLSQSQETKKDAIEHLRASLYLWTNPFVDYATSESDFDIASLKNSKITIYVGLSPTYIDRLKPLMRLFYNHAFERLVKSAESLGFLEENGGVTIILDEFCTLGKLNKYAFAYFRGYKVRLLTISSDIQQIEELYGKMGSSSIIADCHFKVFFASNDPKTAEYISSLCIDKNEGKELLSWQQIMSLSQDSQIILLDKEQPIVSKKIKYYDDEELVERIIDPAKL
ncbi:Type IV secretion system component VirD4 [Candidatus Cyrtobacter comes]|uniref:Type IV secretion system component VirD4 n=1 Tax=Candidatus Cyrtobacter comes TaxID=675776 RepID=A0ABU5L6S0_9RICK|nr:type IV secretory system conjugative DNA transfer family protein [Candidatus Cyrtobacter comes]MDZ5761816.1 Type IV secretion system component VirD4 [Candidatus Cyrtobacter comes]